VVDRHRGGWACQCARYRRESPPELGAEIERVLWSALRPDDRLQRDRIGVVRTPGRPARRSEALALAQLLIVAYLVGVLDGAFDL